MNKPPPPMPAVLDPSHAERSEGWRRSRGSNPPIDSAPTSGGSRNNQLPGWPMVQRLDGGRAGQEKVHWKHLPFVSHHENHYCPKCPS